LSNYDFPKPKFDFKILTILLRVGLAPFSQTAGSLLRTPWPEKWTWCVHSSDELGAYLPIKMLDQGTLTEG